MLIRIDPADRTALYEQVAASVRGAVARGEVAPGDRLPTAREVAALLDINMHTVLRAYQILRDEGVIELRRGRGAVIAQNAPTTAELTTAIDRLLEVARRHGVSIDALITTLTERSAP
ncbi:GntR family transcriptional regulator [Gordonia crocea]|uniref:GntR family transcriptional regulator n=1 Tax=Gordonia crocea TaxID=589162 RepID=A0A7I9UZP1_9ACTN|nr:GntR family transcriptional regulator [Gordonia crocea]GED98396.1 GntR family transcriptional regulator [Gordonia crocea]